MNWDVGYCNRCESNTEDECYNKSSNFYWKEVVTLKTIETMRLSLEWDDHRVAIFPVEGIG